MDLNVSNPKQRETCFLNKNTIVCKIYLKLCSEFLGWGVVFLNEQKKIIWGTTDSTAVTLLLLDHTRNYIRKETERSELF